jgi:cytochrome c biogenesis protein CcmG, thiol:disulfide interchange protein DsbE
MREKLFSAVAVLAAIGLLLFFARPTVRQGEMVGLGRTAPGFTFMLDGRETSLAEQRGKVVVVNFWATWCPPCVEEMPSLNRLHDALRDEGAIVVGISVDDDRDAYQRFLSEYAITFPTTLDPERHLAAAYGTSMYPETYIIDPRGRIARKIIGAQDWASEEHVSYIRSLVGQR